MSGGGLAGARVPAVLAGAVSLLTAACSVSFGSGGLDKAKLANAITDRIRQVTGVAPQSVSCPSDVKQGKGKDFVCTATMEGQPVTVQVTQTDDAGNVRFAAADAMLRRTDVEHFIQTDLQKKGLDPVTVDCGAAAIVVAKVASTFSCTFGAPAGSGSGMADGAGGGAAPARRQAVVTALSADGRFRVDYTRGGAPATAGATPAPSSHPAGSAATGSAR